MLKIGEIVQTVKGIVETKIDMVKLDIQDQISGILSRLVILILMGGSLLLVLLFLSLSLAFFLSQYFESPHMGFLLVGLLYLLILFILYLIRDNDSTQDQMQKGLKGFIFRARIFKKRRENE
ncbi:phage holin family protein [Algoriphagus aquimarinus]|uniref:Putative Holin-X, holin superfamily III n=1 Tax=Algoriphagus aquimarinus TaxID=237018 RepID=A0A1I0VC29_9BACT|nr:phage holin family protein [Algoriphagus aquimarinus]SFA73798.1 Putative Holin-X, holin superfamily III [Algoriphagus aquimarinus]|tara:strand:+ start:95367 stop:95732 length:366 start_codon:yes stop_codon:yes gene_type:complete